MNFFVLVFVSYCAAVSPVDLEVEEKFLSDMKQFALSVKESVARFPSSESDRAATALHELIQSHERVVSLSRGIGNLAQETEKAAQLQARISTRIPLVIDMLESLIRDNKPSDFARTPNVCGKDIAQFFRICLTGSDSKFEKISSSDSGVENRKRAVAYIRRLPGVTWTGLKKKLREFVNKMASNLSAEVALEEASKRESLDLMNHELETAIMERDISNAQYAQALAQLDTSLNTDTLLTQMDTSM